MAMSGPNAIFELAKTDRQLADRVYATYLSKAAANDIPLEKVIGLAGYAFGYSEYYTMDKTGGMYGMSALTVKGHTANPRFASALLTLAYEKIGREIDRRNAAVGTDTGTPTILFAVQYLMPEVPRFAPAMASAWQELDLRSRVGATPEELLNVQTRVTDLARNRQITTETSDRPEKLDELADTKLDEAEKMVGACERDIVYTRAALHFSFRENFKRAQELLLKVEGEGRADVLRTQLAYAMALSEIRKGNLDDAELHLKKVQIPELKIFAQIKLAEGFLGKSDKISAARVVDTAAVGVEKLADAKDRAGLYFSLAGLLFRNDRLESKSLFDKAIKNLNKLPPSDEPEYYFLRRVPLNCSGDPSGEWWGGTESTKTATIFKAVDAFSKEDLDGANSAADGIGDKATKIRAQAIVAKNGLIKYRSKQ
jgi:hypothetical protein